MTWDAIVVGSGFGGTMAAHHLVQAGQRVLMLERGDWVTRGPHNYDDVGIKSPAFSMDSAYDIIGGQRHTPTGSWHCVGGQSVFYGGASYRFRERDFGHDAELAGDSGAAWPFGYDDLEPYYAEAERLLGVAGEMGGAHEPRRAAEYPNRLMPLTDSARRIHDAATRLGLRPSRIPLAISYGADAGRRACVQCGNCDGYACGVEAKNDLATTILPALVRQGMTLRTNSACVRLVRRGSRIVVVECVDRRTGERTQYAANRVVLAAGALATPHLLLASGLDAVSPAAGTVGRYLMRHRNDFVFGVYARRPNPKGEFDKQVAILDFYEREGSIQQMTLPVGLVRSYVHPLIRIPAARAIPHTMQLLVIVEDQPRRQNGVAIDWSAVDRFGLPRLRVHHQYSDRDERIVRQLSRKAARLLREAGALFTFVRPIVTFSHAVGTVRMGSDERTSPLDEFGRYRGLDNLYVTDASAFPRSGGLNPSLTIAANALRIGAHITGVAAPRRVVARRALPVAYHDQDSRDQ